MEGVGDDGGGSGPVCRRRRTSGTLMNLAHILAVTERYGGVDTGTVEGIGDERETLGFSLAPINVQYCRRRGNVGAGRGDRKVSRCAVRYGTARSVSAKRMRERKHEPDESRTGSANVELWWRFGQRCLDNVKQRRPRSTSFLSTKICRRSNLTRRGPRTLVLRLPGANRRIYREIW